ncbi:hypothetical protein B0H19DRAFT_1157178 [Mycena capillaripes]|nr:hypothetical protein B0H19DRAFT_1157178 [Mycena capillaripes]
MWALLLQSHIRILIVTITRSWNNAFPATFGMHGMSFSNLNRCPVKHPINIFVEEGDDWRQLGTYECHLEGQIVPRQISLLS